MIKKKNNKTRQTKQQKSKVNIEKKIKDKK